MATSAVSAIGLISLLANLGLNYGIVRFLPGDRDNSQSMINTCLTISGLAAIIISLVYLAGLQFWSSPLIFLRQDILLGLGFIAYVTCNVVLVVLNHVYIAARKSYLMTVGNAIFSFLRLPLLFVFVAYLGFSGIFDSLLIAYAVALGISLFVFLPRVYRGHRTFPEVHLTLVSKMTSFSLANYMSQLFEFAPTFIFPLMVLNTNGATFSAYIYVAWLIAQFLGWIPMAVSYSLLAEGSNSISNIKNDVNKSIKFIAVLLIPAIIIITLFGNPMLKVFGSGYAEHGSSALSLFAISTLPISINRIFFGIMRIKKKMKSVVIINAFIAIFSVIFGYMLIGTYDLAGIGIAWLSCQIFASIVILFIINNRRFSGKEAALKARAKD